jgi:MFS family permease
MVIGLVGLAHLLSHFYQIALAPLFPLLRDEFDVSYTALGLIVSLFYGVSGVCQALVGILVDRYGADRLLLFGITTMATAVLLMGLVPAYWLLLPLAVVAALGNSVFHPADLSILSAKVSPQRIGRAFGIHGFGGTCGYFLSPIIIYYGVASFAGCIAVFALPMVAAVALLAAAGFCVAATNPSRDILVRAATPPGATGKVFGFVYSGLDLGGALAPLLFGWLMDGGQFRAVFAAVAAMYVIAILSVLQLKRGRQTVPAGAE